ncbi:cryptochrome DASH [Striga asiatica]|uniref:Cryptochrome DASH n=1 Tax=Striga asiatica TaxID=4170 RepID=A0A5A7Q4C1_STRAF|nr:cryptochrome DASH [Striga asiatica]
MIHNLTIISRPAVIPLFLSSTKLLSLNPTFLSPFSSTMLNPSNAARAAQTVHHVPGLDPEESERVFEQTLKRYSFDDSSSSKNGKGVSIVWFRNDLRILDNEVLLRAWASSEAVLPVYCLDPRIFGSTTYYFGLPKTGALRTQFVLECLTDLKRNLMKRGLNLLIQHGKPEQILPSLAKAYGAHTIYSQKETCSEELNVERRVSKNLKKVESSKLELIWGTTMYHIYDLPFDCTSLPDIYTQFRKSVESKSVIRSSIKVPASLGPTPDVKDWGCIPDISSLGVGKGMSFTGGETAALSRVHEYFWKKVKCRLGISTLAAKRINPCLYRSCFTMFHSENFLQMMIARVLFELIWRDYFRFLSIKQGNSIFHSGGPRNVKLNWSQNQALFDAWREGQTGYPLVDANMKELSATGFMSNRGRQIVCSFLVRDMGIDWRMGAEWFETCLLDYDPCSNYGNWTYGAGVGNDPREDRYFSIPKQAQNYDPDGDFVAYWLPQLKALPKEKRHNPGMLYIKPIVALKFGKTKSTSNRTAGPSGFRRTAKEVDSSKLRSYRGNRTQ